MKTYSIGQFAKELGVTVQTLRNWDKSGKMKPNHVSPSGHRYYSEDQLTCSSGESDIGIELLLGVLSVFKGKMGERYINSFNKFMSEIKETQKEDLK